MKKYFLLLLLPFLPFAEDSVDHQFAGKHFFASYLECDRAAISNIDGLLAALEKAIQASGATILSQATHVFPPTGLTAVFLLSESHASIHTWPESGACFVDLFTCGENCYSEPFDQLLREYLQPQVVNARKFIRHTDVEEIK